MEEFVVAMGKSMYRSIAASILQSCLSKLGITYGDVKGELEGITPIYLALTMKKTEMQIITFLGS